VTRLAWLVVAGVLFAVTAALEAGTRGGELSASVHLAPVFVFAGGSALALIARRSRLVIGLAVIALADRAMIHLEGTTVAQSVALLLPVNLGVLAWLPEAQPFTAPGAARLGLVAAQSAVVWFLHRSELAALSYAPELANTVTATVAGWTAVPGLAVVAFGVGLAVTIVQLVVQRRGVAAGVAWAMVASFVALDGAMSGRPASAHFATAGILLIAAVMTEPLHTLRDNVSGLPARLELYRALLRMPRRYAIACVEIDDFEAFRSRYGADAARRVLRTVSRALEREAGRGSVFHADSQRFVLLFRRMSAVAAAQRLDRARQAVPRMTIDARVREEALEPPLPFLTPREAPAGEKPPEEFADCTVAVTISAGVAEASTAGKTSREVLSAAMQALDGARQRGHHIAVAR
jgi:GGDEF domain-containing protein